MSKGSTQRPSQIPDKQVKDNWDRIFKSKPKGKLRESSTSLKQSAQ